MILKATRGKQFSELFAFKNNEGKPIAIPDGDYAVTLERGDFVRHYDNLRKLGTGVSWTINREEVDALPFSAIYFSLTFNGGEIARGVLRVK